MSERHSILADAELVGGILDAFPSPVFVVDDDVRILFYNRAAEAMLDGGGTIERRGGDAMHCVNAMLNPDGAGEGCGLSAKCAACVIRNSVGKSSTGSRVTRQRATMRFARGDFEIETNILVTSSPFLHKGRTLVLLVIEDISELIQLRSLLPICAWCKKIRDNAEYWHGIEEYLTAHLDLDFTHTICEECSRKMEAEADSQPLQ